MISCNQQKPYENHIAMGNKCCIRLIIDYNFTKKQEAIKKSMGVGIVSTNRGDFTFQSANEAIEFIQKTSQENNDIWISGEQPYPCIAVCINKEYAAINYFQNDTGDIWLSYNDKNQKEVTFIADGSEWTPDPEAVITLNDALSCIREFLNTYEKPTCIQWQEL